MDVGRLIRISFGGVTLGDMPIGTLRAATEKELTLLYRYVER